MDPQRIGVRPLGSYWGAAGEPVDTTSGNLNFSIPLMKVVSRGGWSVTFALSYNSQMWRQDSAGTWLLGFDSGYGLGWMLQAGSLIPIWNSTSQIDHYRYVDATGAEYSLTTNTSGIWTPTGSTSMTGVSGTWVRNRRAASRMAARYTRRSLRTRTGIRSRSHTMSGLADGARIRAPASPLPIRVRSAAVKTGPWGPPTVSLTDPNFGATYTAGRLAAVSFAGGQFTYEYSYTPTGRVITQRMSTTAPGGPSPTTLDATYAWDNEGRLSSRTYPGAPGNPGTQYQYPYDPMGRLSGLKENICYWDGTNCQWYWQTQVTAGYGP